MVSNEVTKETKKMCKALKMPKHIGKIVGKVVSKDACGSWRAAFEWFKAHGATVDWHPPRENVSVCVMTWRKRSWVWEICPTTYWPMWSALPSTD